MPLAFSLISNKLNPVSELMTCIKSNALSEGFSLANSDKLSTTRLFISCTALLVKVIARMLR